ncbi:MAG: Prophage antirepressor [Candidatus Gottesmanbacteria bacterium GW2011_GWB1_43_11]|uniref:Prophage antirepressor n=1 Tax=Candidatus Gottesmanbacteria bacterium GW2011_GWB1_43_11 TaxID=1618446 RepID=A0A0G1CP09_9BACT|nr:MAG: Prophage antirepressor [Candidatus Gottesmanbacteria bacterium GW2011_GWA2_42_16]KKS54266.1 MAG: Prophage antirepressor [Candidatus Gottesmanbacteria bacterium GW2011_GWA1_42_26]KKS81303.1 MAG: Prophage antirepressor [Candidatus Gottesmanbacteria bacterium GW2011_GWC1_43_10]KKS87289.1 MAG: Prophage antirepressor [Candidatus Gottesmanbacteria bacterium GW2011_GWB1_43_11]OGG09392.1 MAG: phage antirepressor protein [Candidatus Gottesmanbacteria bacterium RIFCSPHIGHO2_01_FULL_43_15]OGG2521
MEETTKIAIFKGQKIRKTIYHNEWWFVVEDVVLSLIDSNDPKQYIQRMKFRDSELSKGWVQIVHTLSIETTGGKQQMNCANTEGIFRIIQSIPSPKAEPFKRWLARVGYERIQEIEDPELATKRTRVLYKAKGYSDDWIEKRMRGIAIREELTDEWKKRKVGGDLEYAILTAEISEATFGMTPSEYKKFKRLKRENLRDHMDDLELIFTMLGEASTTRITRAKNTRGFPQNKQTARQGGAIAGNARRELERKSGQKVSTSQNYLKTPQDKTLLKK